MSRPSTNPARLNTLARALAAADTSVAARGDLGAVHLGVFYSDAALKQQIRTLRSAEYADAAGRH